MDRGTNSNCGVILETGNLSDLNLGSFFNGIEFFEILRNLFLIVSKIEEMKVNIHKWLTNNLPFNGICKGKMEMIY